MYGHAYWDSQTNEIIEDFMKYNSHSEIPVNTHRTIVKHEPIQCTFSKDKSIINQIMVKPIGYKLTSIGIDPVNRRVSAKGEEIPYLAALIAQCKWDIKFPDVDSLCPWIERHFGARGDFDDWFRRSPFLTINADSIHYKRDQYIISQEFWGEGLYDAYRDADINTSINKHKYKIIDRFRKNPNKTWERGGMQRQDDAQRLLEKLYC